MSEVMKSDAARAFADSLRNLHVPGLTIGEIQRALQQAAACIDDQVDRVDDQRRGEDTPVKDTSFFHELKRRERLGDPDE